MNKLVAAYYRSSSDIQENSVGIQQSKAIEKAIKLGLNIDLNFPDEYISARKLKMHERPQMNALITQIKSGNIGKILVYKRDRIARKADEYLHFYYLCKEENVEVIFTSGNEKDLSYDYTGEFLEHIMAGFVELEGDNIHQRHLQAQKSKFENNNLWAQVPYGYFMDGNKNIQRDETKLEQVREIFHQVLSRNHATLNDLCKYLNDVLKWRREITKGRKKGESIEWKVAHLETILRHPLYIGIHVMDIGGDEKKQIFEHLAIVDQAQFMEANEITESMKPSRGGYKPDHEFLLDGLLFCSICNNPLKSRKKETERGVTEFYACPTHKKLTALQKDEINNFIINETKVYAIDLIHKNWDKYVSTKLAKHEKVATMKIREKSNAISAQYVEAYGVSVKQPPPYHQVEGCLTLTSLPCVVHRTRG